MKYRYEYHVNYNGTYIAFDTEEEAERFAANMQGVSNVFVSRHKFGTGVQDRVEFVGNKRRVATPHGIVTF